MSAKQDLHPDDEVVTLSEDGKSAETKKAPTAEELKAAKAKADAEDDGDEGEEDERHAVGAGESAEEAEARRITRKATRKARKDHRRDREAAKDAELAELRDRLASVEGRVTSVTNASSTQTIAIVDQRISEATQARELADAALEVAITKNDGKAFRDAQKARDLAVEALRQLGDYKKAYTEHTKQQPQGGAQGPSPQLVSHAKQFKADNPWVEFNPDGADDDSKKVHRLDASVKAAGYDPNTPEYWEELQARVDRAFPAKLAEAAEGAEEEEETPPARRSAAANGARRGPAMGGGRSSGNLGKNDIVIPKAVREAAEAAGYWKDPKDRADFIKRWKASSEKYGAAK